MPTQTLLLAPNFTEDSEALWRAALGRGWEIERVLGWSVPQGVREDDLAYYGSLRPPLAALLMESLGRVLLWPPADWLPGLPERYRRRRVELATLGATRRVGGPAFIKPAEEKQFPARVYATGASLPEGEALQDDLSVLVSEPVEWEVEFRCFVRDRQALTCSPYWRNGRLAQTPDGTWTTDESDTVATFAFCGSLLADPDVLLPPAVALDIGRIRGRGWAVVEANPAWSSGLYGCTPEQVLSVLRRACLSEVEVSEADRPWLLPQRSGVIRG